MRRAETSNLRAIALEAGVSVDTVSRVLNGRIKGLRKDAVERAHRIQTIADQLQYRPNSNARSMRSNRTQQVGVLLRNNPGDRYTHPLAFETIVGINEGLEAAGYVLSIVRIGDVERGGGRSRALRERVLDGMIVVDAMTPDQQRRIEDLSPVNVWCDSNVWRDTGCVRRDEHWAGTTAAEAMASLGYRRFVWLGVPERSEHIRNYSLPERYAGVREVATARGIELVDQNEHDRDKYDHAEQLLTHLRPDTAVISYGVYQARWLAHLAGSAGKTPGHDFGLVACDGGHDLFRQWPGLSRVDFDRFEMGRQAAQMLISMLEGDGNVIESRRLRDRYIAGNTAWGPQGERKLQSEEEP